MPPPTYIYEGNDVIRDREIFAAKSQELKWYWTLLIYLAVLFLLAPIYFSFDLAASEADSTRNIPLAIALGTITLIIALIELLMYWMIRKAQCMTIRGKYFYLAFFSTQFVSAVVFILSMIWSSGMVGTTESVTVAGNDILLPDQQSSNVLFALWVLRKLFTVLLMVLITGRMRYIVNLYVNTKRLREEDEWKNYYAQLVVFFPAAYIDFLVEIYASYILEFYNGYKLQYSSSSIVYFYATVVLAIQLAQSRDWRHSILDWDADLRLAIISLIIFLIWCVIVTQEPETYMFDFLIAGLGQYNLMVYGFDILVAQYIYCREFAADTGHVPMYSDSLTRQPHRTSVDETGDAAMDHGSRQGRATVTSNKDWYRRLDELQNRALYQLNVDLSAEQPYTLHTMRTPGDRTMTERQWEVQRHKNRNREEIEAGVIAQVTSISSDTDHASVDDTEEGVHDVNSNFIANETYDGMQQASIEQTPSVTTASVPGKESALDPQAPS
ncbi:hypothetical protein SARC_06156 [Sphaeroforma arctica JP610]|uniref:Uncharacterized protein n=1 Tax=Sphaeroforma arctica JP610 TaxID=667725 RepID=A0A0L0FY17_9EUKA|nr:hypothetical protein SARC_06156 [Sphaeroforma arctica JP610]KNC81529.1 hypothetical protein SARC_06156 [Sphaeroforma arctica JP610]|eukprot:XP_014155431.1 hypothetical protein SARC_06156 [Sphaeroforma arctica JP610]